MKNKIITISREYGSGGRFIEEEAVKRIHEVDKRRAANYRFYITHNE